MNAKRILAAVTVSVLCAGLFTGPAPAASEAKYAPTVVELFTSQGCYSCPPAEAFLRDLADQKSVIALEFHVDYWDELVYGAAGKWKDAFSKREFTERQARYNQAIRGRANVYTPQMVIDGRLEAVGSQRLSVLAAIREVEDARRDRIAVSVSFSGGDAATVNLAGESGTAGAPVDVWIVRMIRERETEVRSGENKGKSLTSRNIVTELRHVGGWKGGRSTISVPDFALGENETCAVLVQDRELGPVRGAAYCPSPAS